MAKNFVHLSAVGNTGLIGAVGADAFLHSVCVGTGVASAVLTIREGGASGNIISVVDCTTVTGRFLDFRGARCKGGLYAALAGGNADVTLVFE